MFLKDQLGFLPSFPLGRQGDVIDWMSMPRQERNDSDRNVGERGPAVSAYRAVLATSRFHELGKYAWVLEHAEVNAVFCLSQAQRRALRACADAYDQKPGVFSISLRRDHHRLAFWSLVLRHNARYDPNETGHHAEIEYPPTDCTRWEYGVVAVPEGDLFSRSWLCALVMDPARLTPFFFAAYRGQTEDQVRRGRGRRAKEPKGRRRRYPACPMIPLRCPADWFPR